MMVLHTLLTDSPEEAAAFIKRGELVAFPTETVFGLGASALNVKAVEAIYRAKGRPADNPLIVHIHSLNQIADLVTEITEPAHNLIDAFFPGPLTVILKRSNSIPPIVSAGLNSLALRMPDHEIALAFLKACGVPVAAPSANRSGRPSPTTWQDVYSDMKDRISCILMGEASPVGLESTVVDCRGGTAKVLRPGGIPIESIQRYVPRVQLSSAAQNGVAASPGMKYRHYSPDARVHIVSWPEDVPAHPSNAFLGLHPHPFPERLGLHMTCTTLDEYAHELYRFFRRCDRAGITDIYCEGTAEQDLGLALMDRIRRAAFK